MSTPPKISEAEWEVMKVLWKESPLSAAQVAAHLAEKTPWQPKTVKTLIDRLIGKGAIGFRKEGRGFQFFPLVEEAACIQSESQTFLDRLFGGALRPMVAHMVENKKLSGADIKELQELLRKHSK
ncbi:MAG: BlaI/MecI/CopY family transcriptional regulator [Verrucomicrobiota bacterium]